MTERERFEVWIIKEKKLPVEALRFHTSSSAVVEPGREYVSISVNNYWQAWQARAALDSSKMEQATNAP